MTCRSCPRNLPDDMIGVSGRCTFCEQEAKKLEKYAGFSRMFREMNAKSRTRSQRGSGAGSSSVDELKKKF